MSEYEAYVQERGVAGQVAIGKVNTGGTRTPSSGERNGRSRLKASDILGIRTRLAAVDCGEDTIVAIAADHGVSLRAITMIRDGKNWAGVAYTLPSST